MFFLEKIIAKPLASGAIFAPSKTSGTDQVRECSGALCHRCFSGHVFSLFLSYGL